MCGIAGSTQTNQQALVAMQSELVHRGPDGGGLWLDDASGTGLSHTRLKVIDLSDDAAQPMTSENGRYVLTFNGEIYNFKELRRDLEKAGASFRSNSDTEVLLELLARDGTAALEKLVGMFAFALWDKEKRELILARDRLGIKPLVYATLAGGNIAFASEITALRKHPGIDLTTDTDAVSEYLACLYIPAPRTIYNGIRKLPPGHVLRWHDGNFSIDAYWRPKYNGTAMISADEAVEELMPIVRQAVTDRLVSDVPLGCFLSGGIDSSVIAALMANEAKRTGAPPIQTFTMTFDEAAYDERSNARKVAEYIGSHHTELPASPSLVDLLDDSVTSFGEPFGNPTSLLINDLSRKAREHVTVALVGDGGDEVFAGYPRYQGGLWAQKYRCLPRWLRENMIAPMASLIPESTRGYHSLRRAREFLTGANLPNDQMYASWVEYFNTHERQQLMNLSTEPERPIAQLYKDAPSQNVLDAMQQTDLQSFLPGNLLAYGDAMSMRHALELRLPLIDHRLIEKVSTLSPQLRVQGGLKFLLKKIAGKLLPQDIATAPKRGFNPPMGVWLKNNLKEMVAERLTAPNLSVLGLEAAPVTKLLHEFNQGRRDHSLKIWALLVLETWHRQSHG
ncbi:MAG: asparagine synthase (glutamine-hydrolyzing) [Rhodospirillales bacterium]|jgi:asparagine synthase (glutamine-hydrolysing)